MSCVVKCCKNRSDRRKKNPGITFHRFSNENEVWKNDWIQIIRNCNGEKNWIPNKYSVICSIHFEANDLYATKGGLRRVVTYAVPQRFLFESTHMVEELHAAVPYSPSVSQESASVTVPALEQPDSPTLILQRERASVIAPSLEQPCFSTVVIKPEEQLDEPYIPATGTKAFEQPDSSTLVFQEEQPEEANVSSIKEESSSETGEAEQQVLSILYSPRKRRLKQSLIKKQEIIKKQKRYIKTLRQKVKRLQNRNKSLKDILKFLKG